MRRGTCAVGLSLLVLIVIAGCASPQNGPRGQNPSWGNNPVTTSPADSWTSTTLCTPPPSNPARFQKFYPVVSGWDGKNGTYYPSDRYSMLVVTFTDMGTCGTVDELFKSTPTGTKKEGNVTTTVNRIDNFHGYPALHVVVIDNTWKYTDYTDIVYIAVNNRLYVYISAKGGSYYYSLSEAEADIETFASAIDYQGLAAAV